MKIIRSIISFFSKLIDRLIVMPISKFILLINKKFEKPSKRFENWLSRTNTLLFISLVLSITIFVVIDQKILTYSESSAEVLTINQVRVDYDQDNYVVEGIPESVDITLIGNKADLYIAKQSPTNEVVIDLWGYRPGTHKVDIKYNQLSGNISHSVNPSSATVVIYEKVSSNKTLSVDLLNQDSLDPSYIIDEVNAVADSATVKGASYKVEEVATVKALVDINNLPDFELGEKIKISAPLRAYDEEGNAVDVEISPSRIDVELLIDSPSKEVPIQIVPIGSVVYNMGISDLIINNNQGSTVTLYGPSEVLANIDNIPVNINVDGLSEDTQFKVDLEKPNGVKHMSMSSVTIDVKLSNDISNAEIPEISIRPINKPDNYKVVPLEFETIPVKIKGVTDIVNRITADDINLYIDVSGLDVGVHKVEIIVDGNDPRVEYTPAILKINVRILKE